jgi:serine/threonine protein kinase
MIFLVLHELRLIHTDLKPENISLVRNNHRVVHIPQILFTCPDVSFHLKLRLYLLSLERSALLAQFEVEERYAVELAQIAYEEERERVEEAWWKGRERVREAFGGMDISGQSSQSMTSNFKFHDVAVLIGVLGAHSTPAVSSPLY